MITQNETEAILGDRSLSTDGMIIRLVLLLLKEVRMVADPEPGLEQMCRDFAVRFDLPQPKSPIIGTAEATELVWLRVIHIEEELEELKQAAEDQDLEAIFDALIDIVYVAIGASINLGLPFTTGFAAVHQANMRKVRAQKSSQSKRLSTWDVVKPEGWVPADLNKILKDAGL